MSGPAAIRKARADAGLTQQELAHRANCSVAYVRVLEGGYAPDPSASPTRTRVLEVLGVNDDRPRGNVESQ